MLNYAYEIEYFDRHMADMLEQLEASCGHVLIGKERHDAGSPHDQDYPIRGIVKGDYLFLHNFETDRWPAGNPETGYLNVR